MSPGGQPRPSMRAQRAKKGFSFMRMILTSSRGAKNKRRPKAPFVSGRRLVRLLVEGFLALGLERRQQHDDDQQQRRDQQAGRERPRDEHGPVAARQQQRAAQVLFHHRPEDEAEQQRRRLAAELDEQVADDAEDRDHPDVEGVVVGRVHADAAEHQDRREEPAVGHRQQLDPDADQRQVQDHQHQVADPHRGDQAPEQLRVAGHHLRAGLDVVDGHRADHQRHHRRWAGCRASAAG